jgi:hypothetical protein
VYFGNDYKKKPIENIREIRYVFFGNNEYNISAASGAPITVKGNGVSSTESLDRSSRRQSMAP